MLKALVVGYSDGSIDVDPSSPRLGIVLKIYG